MTREERLKKFNESKARIVKKREDEASKKNNNFTKDYEDLYYTVITEKDWQLIRVIDGFCSPYDPDRLPTSPKEILRAYIINDEGKGCWINFSADKKWFLWRVFNKVLSYTWNPDIGEKGAKEYHNKDKFPTLYNRVKYNGKISHTSFENGWYPTKYIAFNHIDRLSKEWHQKNKHTKLISKKSSVKDGNTFYEPGIPPTVYSKNIYQGVVEDYGFIEDYDFGIRKVKSMDQGVESTSYEVQHSKFLVDKEKIKDCIITSELTEEELNYEKYDLDKLFPVSNYHKIKKNLDLFIKDVDKKLGTNFSIELTDLVAEEKIRFDEIYGNNTTKEETQIVREETKEVPKSRKPVKVENLSINPDKDESKIIEIYPKYINLKQDEKDSIIGIDENNELLFVEGDMIPCPEEGCKKPQPELISTLCIYCGTEFE